MTDPKVGDRVQVKPHTASYGVKNWSGPGEVVRDTVDGYLIVAFDDSGLVGGFRPNEIEAVQKPMRSREEIEAVQKPMRSREEIEAELARLSETSSWNDHDASKITALNWVLNSEGDK